MWSVMTRRRRHLGAGLAVVAPVISLTLLVMFITVSTSNREFTFWQTHGQPLQAHAGVDVLLLQLGVVALAVVVKLGEHVVPDLHIPVAVAAHGAAGLAAAVLGAPVIVDLGAGAAGAGAVLPEVVLLAEAEDPLRGNADLSSFQMRKASSSAGVVSLPANTEGYSRSGSRPTHSGAGEELPGPVDGVLLK